MQAKGSISKTASGRSLSVILGVHAVWLAIVMGLGVWWSKLVLRQAAWIAELESALGLSRETIDAHLQKTSRIVFWEWGTFYVLLVLIAGLLFWFYWRDMVRARSLHAFFASVTHELRTPLTSIRLQAESIADNAPDDTQQKQLVDRLLEDTLRLESQVERTLELARLEGGGPLFTQPLQLRPWLEHTLQYWRETFKDRVNVELRVEDIFVSADPGALQVIVKNLLENSLRHARRKDLLIAIESRVVDDVVLLFIRDNGPGFKGDAKELGGLFQKGPESQGAGVGLYLIRTLMERMGGRADFRNVEGFEAVLTFKQGSENG